MLKERNYNDQDTNTMINVTPVIKSIKFEP